MGSWCVVLGYKKYIAVFFLPVYQTLFFSGAEGHVCWDRFHVHYINAVRIMAEALCESMLFSFDSFVFSFCEYHVVGRGAMSRVEGLGKPGFT